MTVLEHCGILKYKDKNGSLHLIMPVTKKECVDGMDDFEDQLNSHKHNVKDLTGVEPGGHFLRGSSSGGVTLSSPEEARVDIGAAKILAPVTVTLAADGWVQNAQTKAWEQTVACVGLLATDDQRTEVRSVSNTADGAAQALTDAAFACMDRAACLADGSLYCRCQETKPKVNFQAVVIIKRS